jgi:RNA 2',3'-cyclic 3'-phosphodiesterase
MAAASIAGFDSLPERVRAFIALRLDPAVDGAIADAIAGIIGRTNAAGHDETGDRARDDGIRWVRRENFHLTLFFLGPAVPRARLLSVADALGAVAKRTAPFEIAARGLGAFPNPSRPQVIWAGLRGDELVALAARVAAAAERCGFAPERRAYTPHLTIGRVRSIRSARWLRHALGEAANLSFGVSRVERIALYRSEPGPAFSTYHELAAFALAAGESAR